MTFLNGTNSDISIWWTQDLRLDDGAEPQDVETEVTPVRQPPVPRRSRGSSPIPPSSAAGAAGEDRRAADGGNSDRAADHGEGKRQSESELFHRRLLVQVQVEQAATGVLPMTEMAVAPPITAKASIREKTSFFIERSRLVTTRVGIDGGRGDSEDSDCAAEHGEDEHQREDELFHRVPQIQPQLVQAKASAANPVMTAAPPRTAKARARPRTSCFMGVLPVQGCSKLRCDLVFPV